MLKNNSLRSGSPVWVPLKHTDKAAPAPVVVVPIPVSVPTHVLALRWFIGEFLNKPTRAALLEWGVKFAVHGKANFYYVSTSDVDLTCRMSVDDFSDLVRVQGQVNQLFSKRCAEITRSGVARPQTVGGGLDTKAGYANLTLSTGYMDIDISFQMRDPDPALCTLEVFSRPLADLEASGFRLYPQVYLAVTDDFFRAVMVGGSVDDDVDMDSLRLLKSIKINNPGAWQSKIVFLVRTMICMVFESIKHRRECVSLRMIILVCRYCWPAVLAAGLAFYQDSVPVEDSQAKLCVGVEEHFKQRKSHGASPHACCLGDVLSHIEDGISREESASTVFKFKNKQIPKHKEAYRCFFQRVFPYLLFRYGNRILPVSRRVASPGLPTGSVGYPGDLRLDSESPTDVAAICGNM